MDSFTEGAGTALLTEREEAKVWALRCYYNDFLEDRFTDRQIATFYRESGGSFSEAARRIDSVLLGRANRADRKK